MKKDSSTPPQPNPPKPTQPTMATPADRKRKRKPDDGDRDRDGEEGITTIAAATSKKERTKRPKSTDASPSPPPPTFSLPLLPPPPPPPPPSKSALQTRRRGLRKSVSFTADTKATDGDSIKTLYENHDPFAHYASYQQHISEYPTNELPAGFDDDATTTTTTTTEEEPREKKKKKKEGRFESPPPPSQKKKKKRRRSEKRKDAKEDVEDDATDAKLAYLLAYHTTRDTWRFEKAKQNWILRHAFSAAMIPEDRYGDALKAYITGLLAPAARDRLVEEANEIVKRGKDTISKDGEKLDPEDQKTNVARAKLVLSALGHEDDDDDDDDEEDSESSEDKSSGDE